MTRPLLKFSFLKGLMSNVLRPIGNAERAVGTAPLQGFRIERLIGKGWEVQYKLEEGKLRSRKRNSKE